MSEEKVHEINPEGELKNSPAPNQFATSIGNLLTRSNPERAIGDAIDHLVDQRLHWENHELASSNDALYALLQHCYSLNNAMSGSDGTAKALRKGFTIKRISQCKSALIRPYFSRMSLLLRYFLENSSGTRSPTLCRARRTRSRYSVNEKLPLGLSATLMTGNLGVLLMMLLPCA